MTKSQTFYSTVFLVLIALMPLIAVDLPRFMAFGPGIIGVVFLALFMPVFKDRPALPLAALIIAACVLGLALASIAWSVAPEVSLERVQKLALIFVPGLALISLALSLDVDKLRRWLWLIPASVALAMVLLSVEMIFDGPLFRLTRGMSEEDYVHPHVFNRGAVTAVLCYFPAVFLAGYTSRPRLLRTLLTIAAIGLMFTSDSQSAQLALIIGLAFLVLFPFKARWAWYGLGAILSALILSTPWLCIWVFDNFAVTLNNLPFFGGSGGSAGGRLEIWDYVSRYTLEHNPWYGLGIEATKTITTFETQNIFKGGNEALHPHNFSVQLWIEFGVIGALAGACACLSLLYIMYKRLSPAQSRITLPALIATLSIAATGYGMWQSWWIGLLFMISALTIIAVRLQKPE